MPVCRPACNLRFANLLLKLHHSLLCQLEFAAEIVRLQDALDVLWAVPGERGNNAQDDAPTRFGYPAAGRDRANGEEIKWMAQVAVAH